MPQKDTNKKKKDEKLSYTIKPPQMSLEEWQTGLRKKAAQNERFIIKPYDHGEEPGAYHVTNSVSGRSYKVVYRGENSLWNFCSCMDYKTNQLGTCKHIEAVKQWMETKQIPAEDPLPPYTSVYVSYKNGPQLCIRIGSEKAEDFERLAGIYFDEKMEIRHECLDDFPQFMAQARAISSSFRCYPDALQYVTSLQNKAKRISMVETECTDTDLDNLLHTSLYPYQKEGIRFALKAGKCLIADEMGLGKTLQAIGTAEWLLKKKLVSNILILCPTSLKYQWQHEIERFTDTTVQIIEGNQLQRSQQYHDEAVYKIISYNSASNDIKQYGSLKTDLLIMDEAQRLKNWNTQIAQTARHIESEYTVVLSGTPLENRPQELYSIIQFVDQFCLGPYYRFNDFVTIFTENGQIAGYRNLHTINSRLSHVLIRRTKDDVCLQLPPRTDKNLFVSMTKEQRALHDDFQHQVSILVHKWRQTHFLLENERKRLLLLLNQMRMVCDSTFILDQQTRYDTKISELVQIIEDMRECGNEKMVVFSQWERMTRLVCQELDRRHIEYANLNGGVPSVKRKELIERFDSSPDCRVFISTDAGSTGLNLQNGSIVVNLDLPWNPAVLEQRIARIHRIGQKHHIQVINFISERSIEERMTSTLQFKTELAEGILGHGEDEVTADTNKLATLMSRIEELTATDDTCSHTAPEEKTEKRKNEETITPEPHTTNQVEKKTEEQLLFSFGEENNEVPPQTQEKAENKMTGESEPQSDCTGHPEPSDKQAMTPEQELIADSFSVLNRLAESLSTPEKTEALTEALTREDPETGEVKIEIPVPDKESVRRLLTLFGRLLNGGM